MDGRFGADYAKSVAADFRLSSLGATVNEALERGDSTKAVWRAVSDEIPATAKAR
jgi:Protein of unknown function (DUF3046)